MANLAALLALGADFGLLTISTRPSGGVHIAVDENGTPLSKSRAPFALSQGAIIRAVQTGKAEWSWVELPTHRGFFVFADALKIAGIRVPVTARTTAVIANLLDAMPTTPLVEDLMYDHADVRTTPRTYDPSRLGANILQSNEAVLGFNAHLDAQVATSTETGLVSDVGKSWVLSNAAARKPGRAVNYGLHVPSAPYQSVDGKSKVWQQPSTRHDPDHWDYSQTCRLCKYGPEAPAPGLPPSHEELNVSTLWV